MNSKDIYSILLQKCPKENKNIHYLKRYVKFIFACIEHNKNLPKDTYTENHHILPRSMWPEYSYFEEYDWNCSTLTIRQHLIAHWILAKTFGDKMWFAFNMMTGRSDESKSIKELSNIKGNYSKAIREFYKSPEGIELVKNRTQKLKDRQRNTNYWHKMSKIVSDYMNTVDEETGLTNGKLNSIKGTKSRSMICKDTGLSIASVSNYKRAHTLRTEIDEETGLSWLQLIALKSADTKDSIVIDGVPYYKVIGAKISESLNKIDNESGMTIAQKRGKAVSRTRIEKGIAKGKNNPMYGKYGKNNPNYGSKRTEETKRKMSESNKKPKIKSPCVHCGKMVDPGNMKKWHGDKCKFKKAQ